MSATRVQVTGDRFHPAMPEGAVYVGRPGPYLKGHDLANPHPVGDESRKPKPCKECAGAIHTRAEAVELYREHMASRPDLVATLLRYPPDSSFACRCPAGLACHVDVLLELLG